MVLSISDRDEFFKIVVDKSIADSDNFRQNVLVQTSNNKFHIFKGFLFKNEEEE